MTKPAGPIGLDGENHQVPLFIVEKEQTRKLLEYLNERNCSERGACAAAGFSWRSYQRWKAKGLEGEEPYAQFLKDVEHACAMKEARYVECVGAKIDAGHPDSWKAAIALLERQFRDRYHKREEIAADTGFEVKVIEKSRESAHPEIAAREMQRRQDERASE